MKIKYINSNNLITAKVIKMGDKEQLGYLINLVDDEADEVRSEILKELSNYGSSLEEDLKDFPNVIEPGRMDLIKPILENNRRIWLNSNWNCWFDLKNENAKLELAMSLIAQFQYGINYKPSINKLVNELAESFRVTYPFGTELDLSDFLFGEKEIMGDQKDYYNPLNSNLIYVINNRKGIPISLTILLILVGNRLGYEIEGCNFPGHFLAKIRLEKEILLIDCFNNGKFIYQNEIQSLMNGTAETILRLLEIKTSSTVIIRRVLSNLINAYRNSNILDQSNYFRELLSKTPM